MPIQTTYTPILAPAVAGMIADERQRTVLSREVMQAASSGMQFGVPVLQGNTDHTCAPVGTAGASTYLLGISVLDPTVRPANSNAYAAGDTAAIIIEGAIWVLTNGAVTVGAPAYYTSGGAITATASGNTALPGGVFETSTAAAGLAVLRVNNG